MTRLRLDGKPDGRSQNGKHLPRISKKGTDMVRKGKMPAALTKHAWDRMHREFNYDPLAAAVQIAKGEALTQDHPFLKHMEKMLSIWRKKAESKEVIEVSDIDLLMKMAEEMLTDSWVSHELRSKHILDLLAYIYPKKKAVDMSHSGSVEMDMKIKPLTAKEIQEFDNEFNEQY